MVKIPQGKQQLIFLENHDLDRFASLETNVAKQKLAAALQLLVGGIPSIYYGQEIGMKGKEPLGSSSPNDGNSIPRREAFEWYKTTTGTGMATWYENTGKWWTDTNLKSNDGISLEEQKGNPASLYNHYKNLLKLRASSEALSSGHYANLENDNEKVFSFIRKKDSKTVLVASNLSDVPQKVSFKKYYKKGKAIFGSTLYSSRIELKPFEVIVWEVN